MERYEVTFAETDFIQEAECRYYPACKGSRDSYGVPLEPDEPAEIEVDFGRTLVQVTEYKDMPVQFVSEQDFDEYAKAVVDQIQNKFMEDSIDDSAMIRYEVMRDREKDERYER